MATIELFCNARGNYFSIWRYGKRKPGDRTIEGALILGLRSDASNQEKEGHKPIAYGPVLEWSE